MAGLSTKYNYDAYLQHRNEQNQNQQNQGQGVVNVQQPANTGNNPAVATQQPTQVAPSAQQSQNNAGEKSLVMKPTVQDGAPNANATADNAVTTGEMKSKLAIAQHFGRRMPEITAETAPSEAAYTAYERRVNPQPQEVERKHGWRDWFKKTDDEEYENRKRERIAAFSDMIRHLANLHYVNQYATPQHIESAYGKVKAEEREQRKLKQERENEDRKWNWKVSEAQRDQANKDRTYGLGVRKDKRAEELQPYKKAEADKKAKRAEYLAQKAAADAEWAPKINDAKEKRERAKASLDLEKRKTERSKQAANNALAAQRRAKAANERDSKLVHFPTNDVNYLWAVNKNDVKVIQTKLRSFAKGRKWAKGYVDEFGNLKRGATDADLLNAAMGNAHDPEVQRFLNTYGKRVRSEYDEEQDFQLK